MQIFRKNLSIILTLTLLFSLLLTACSAVPKDTSALYIYMCGSNLETNSGAATKNIAEILGTDIPEKTTVVIETGGSKKWRKYDISSDSISRYVVENGELVLKETAENASMGNPDTLSDFLNYCTTEYPAEKKGVILWDHGGGSLKGVCYDENYSMDSLTLTELDQAFSSVNQKFDFIGFDACLMATYDTAAVISKYAEYMIASEEIEPSGGWDYSNLVQSFIASTDTEDFGKSVCDSYIEKCKISGKDSLATLSLFDLTKIKKIDKTFESFAKDMLLTTNKKFGNFSILTAVDNSTKFGGNNAVEGYSNLIDLYNLADSLKGSNTSAQSLCTTLDDLIVYKVNGEGRTDAGGVSLYYPSIYDENELTEYMSICKSDEYKNYFKELYTDIPDRTIEFVDSGSEAKDGSFQIALSPDSKKYVKSVDFYLIEFGENKENPEMMTVNGLGIDNDIFKDWDNMKFNSNFRGIWLGLDGKLLSYTVIESNNDRTILSAPVIVNGKETNLRFSFTWDDSYDGGGYYSVIGLWNGIDENGIADKEIIPLKAGDNVTILSRQINEGDYLSSLTEGDTITIGKEGATISEIPLSQKQYQYVYAVTDIFGNVFYSSTAIFEMQYSYDELLKNPLPDGEYAAKVSVITTDVDNAIAYGGVK